MDFLTGTPLFNASVISWAGRENLTYGQIIDKIYRHVDKEGIKILFDWKRGGRLISTSV